MRVSLLILLVALVACSRTTTASLPAPVAAQLRDIIVLYVEPVQASAESEYATEELRRLLTRRGRFFLTSDINAAHAIVRTTISFSRPDLTETTRAGNRNAQTSRPASASPPPLGTLRVSTIEQPDSVLWSWSYVSSGGIRTSQTYQPQTTVRLVLTDLAERFRRASNTSEQ